MRSCLASPICTRRFTLSTPSRNFFSSWCVFSFWGEPIGSPSLSSELGGVKAIVLDLGGFCRIFEARECDNVMGKNPIYYNRHYKTKGTDFCGVERDKIGECNNVIFFKSIYIKVGLEKLRWDLIGEGPRSDCQENI